MNAFDKSFIKAYEQPPENPAKLMPLSAAIELSRENSTPPRIEAEASADSEASKNEIAAEETINEESYVELQADESDEILLMPTPEFQPLLQVDAFAWPKACEQLEDAAIDQIAIVTNLIQSRAGGGRKMIGFVGEQSGSGCTTLLLTLARCLAGRCRVAIVDANRENPGLARDLGLLPDVGLKDVAAGTVPLDEALIESLDDHITLLPYSGHAEADYGHDTNSKSADIRQIAHHYDVVLTDLGTIENPNLTNGNDATLNQIDATLIVQDARCTRTNSAYRIKNILSAASVDILGIVENRTNSKPIIGQEQVFENYSYSQNADAFSDAA